MQVQTSQAPATTQHAGTTVFFCSDHCKHRFTADPDRYAARSVIGSVEPVGDDHQQAGHESHEQGAAGQVTDPVCAMSVDPESAARVSYAGQDFFFCSAGCAGSFTGDPLAHLSEARDPVCGMSVDVAHPGGEAVAAGRRYVFCGPGCAQAFTADPQPYLTHRQPAEITSSTKVLRT